MAFPILSIASLISAIFYLAAIQKKKQTLKYILKPGTMLVIITLALTGLPDSLSLSSYAGWIIIGLLFSVVGDIFLMLPKDRFLYGLLAFLLAHVFYIVAFLQVPTRQDVSIFFTLLLLVIALLFFLRLVKGVKAKGGNKLIAAVFFYILLITGMVWLAALTAQPWIMAAAFLFYLSDASLAWDRFVKPLPYRHYIVMSTYFLAQYLFAASVYLII